MTCRTHNPENYAQRPLADPAPTRPGRPALRITRHCAQGGVISPLLLNVALHGLEAAAGARYFPDGRKDAGVRPTLVLA